MADIRARLLKLVAEGLAVEESEITDASNFADSLGADSLDLVEMTLEIESEFHIEIPDEEAKTLVTFGELVKYVISKVSHKKGKWED